MRRTLIAALAASVFAAEHAGVVRFGGQPVPGASVTASRGGEKSTALTDARGEFQLAEGTWKVQVEMQLFQTETREIVVPGPAIVFDLTMLPQPPVVATAKPPVFQRSEVKTAPVAQQPVDPRAADGLLINGSVNNGASSPFAQLPAFGNFRRGQRSMYNGNLGVIVNNAALDARSFSLTGQNTPKPAYSRVQALLAFGGPLKIPKLLERNGPQFSVNYQWTRNSNASVQTGLMPTDAQRAGAVSPQARALLALYPRPNFTGSDRYNYQIPIVSGLHQDDLQTRMNKQVRRNFFMGSYAWQSTWNDSPDLFGFLETGSVGAHNTMIGYRRSFSPRSFVNLRVEYSRQRSEVTPFFAGRRNVSGEAGIGGNNQEPANWGPPSLIFSSGITGLTMAQSSLNRNQTAVFGADAFVARAAHNLAYGYNLRRQQFNVLRQQDARGTFAFTGDNDFEKFLRGTPDTSSIAFGNADKYLRGTIHEAFLNDDWRVDPSLTINAGVRWEYWSPVREKYGRLVNLDLASAMPSRTLPAADRNNIGPRVAFSWRPFLASSMVVRGGYGVYFDTSVYQPIAMRMAQQAPLSTSLRVSGPGLTLGNGFSAVVSATEATTFGVDPALRVGYSQNWQLQIQRDLPMGLQMTATYNGSKATRALQQFLPNTFPGGAIGPAGFTYLVSNGNGHRNSGQFQLRRRLRRGFTASADYTYAKAIDNAGLGRRASLTAQDWTNLNAERARSNFDQRHLLIAMAQYTTGMGMRRWKGAFLKEWTIGTQIRAGSGLPLTPVFLSPVRGTGVTGSLRPDFTGASLYDAPAGFFLNPLAVAAPAAGRWGNAGRNSINGPHQFTLGASLARTFRSTDRISYDIRAEAANALNTVTFPAWNTVTGNAQFGLPIAANPMRSIQIIFRTRF
ncbi:MAG: TonB-dependent receptor [Acidobacteria bacterium]|nr:TonB-dependent receptor [Acidobacteriota bacterium]